jgi:formate C-acetyltransferase
MKAMSDDVIERTLAVRGATAAEARDYAVVGCAEWGIPHGSFPAAGAGFINLAAILEQTLKRAQAEPTGAALDRRSQAWGSIDAVLERCREQLQKVLREAASVNNAIEETHRAIRPTPFLSTVVGGCLDRGRDVTSGGARRNTSGFQGVGIADVADSFLAIERLVFVERRISLLQPGAILERNFAGEQWLQAYVRHRLEKYGQGEGQAEYFAARVSQAFVEEVAHLSNSRGGHYCAGMWSMTTHQGFGQKTGALPSGRLAGEPLANGISPANGSEGRCPTAVMASASVVAPCSNGAVLNMRLDPDCLRHGSAERILRGLVYGYFEQGGMQVQFNVVDTKVLEAALRDPDRYRDLVVRISGYSAYFNDLTDEMKRELIGRTNHGVQS